MASNRRSRLREWLALHQPAAIGEAEFAALHRDLPDIPEAALRKLVRAAGLPLTPLVEGVRQDDFDALERTLGALQDEYESALASGNTERARQCRSLVITSKDHARLAARRRPEKQEMAAWMLVWLENPPVFRAWAKVRGRPA